MKVSIIGGGGEVGSTVAFELAKKDIVDEISLIDIRENVAKDHKMDMEQAICTLSKTQITSGGYEQLKGSDIVVIAVGAVMTPEEKHQGKVPSRMNFLKANLEIIKSVSENITKFAPDSILINATNPLDVINSVLHRLTAISKDKIIGFSLNDTLRLRWAISKVLDIDARSVQAMVLGEHGEDQCPIFSQIYIDGKKRELSGSQKEEVSNMINNFLIEKASLNGGRTSGWISGINMAFMIECMIKETGEVLPCSIIGEDEVSIGRAVVLSQKGIDRVVQVEMDKAEQEQFRKAHSKIDHILSEI